MPAPDRKPGPAPGFVVDGPRLISDTMPAYCLDCGAYVATGNRCPRHAATHHALRRRVYSDARWQRARRLAMEAAGYRCAACGGFPTPGDPLSAHHADGYDNPFDPSTLVVMHRSCHGRVHGGQAKAARAS